MTVPTSEPVARSGGTLQEFVPGISLIRSYQRGWLGKDVVAGLVLSALLVPQGMAYAELAGLPPVTGLYTSILCLLGYAVFGPSRILVLGPDSSLGPMIAATIAPLVLAGGDPARAVALASVLGLLVGLVMTVAGLAHFGFVADLLSKPTQIGYMSGLALTIIVGQLPKLFGFSVDADGLIDEAKGFVSGVADGLVTPNAALIGVVSLVGILLLQRLLPKIPAVLAVVVVAALTVNLLDLEAKGVDTIGVLPQGFPPLTIPTIPWADVPELLPGRGRHRRRGAGRHDVDGVVVRRPPRRARSRGPGDDRHRRREHRRRPVPGVPRQHQRVAHGRRGAGRVPLAGDRRRRRRGHRLRRRVRDRAHAVRPAAHPRRDRHRGRPVPRRRRGDPAAVAAAPHRSSPSR